ncbi:PoNe immunity protein domain-containing protein [Stenotrophomonas maltophilia]|nr:DUF1911 domain-containing protein [Stenotrophomonas maltophilia]
MKMRDSRKTRSYFDRWIEHAGASIHRKESRIVGDELPRKGRVLAASRLFDSVLGVVVMRYSRGDDIESIKGEVSSLLAVREKMSELCDLLETGERSYRFQFEDIRQDHFVQWLWWLAFALSLDMGREYIERSLTLLQNAGKDELFDAMAVAMGDAGRPVSTQVLYRQYLPLMDAIASPSDRPGLVKKFLDGWYAGSRNVYWHGNHRDDDSGYMGYWAFEAALVVMLFDIDDSSFRDHEYYPADLVAYYGRRAGAGI